MNAVSYLYSLKSFQLQNLQNLRNNTYHVTTPQIQPFFKSHKCMTNPSVNEVPDRWISSLVRHFDTFQLIYQLQTFISPNDHLKINKNTLKLQCRVVFQDIIKLQIIFAINNFIRVKCKIYQFLINSIHCTLRGTLKSYDRI